LVQRGPARPRRRVRRAAGALLAGTDQPRPTRNAVGDLRGGERFRRPAVGIARRLHRGGHPRGRPADSVRAPGDRRPRGWHARHVPGRDHPGPGLVAGRGDRDAGNGSLHQRAPGGSRPARPGARWESCCPS
jgi:hypothetical protein